MRRAVLRVGVWQAFSALILAAFLFVVSCTPAQRADVRDALPAVEAGCVLLHAIAHDGRADDICATAEDLAPFVRAMLEARAENPDAGASARVAFVVAELPRAKRPPPRRRCVSWMPLPSRQSGIADAGDAGDGGP